ILRVVKQIVETQGTPQQRLKAADLGAEMENILAGRKGDQLRPKTQQLRWLFLEIAMAQPGWWVHQFQQMEKHHVNMTDHARASRLLDQGRECITRNNNPGLENAVRQLWDLLPAAILQTAQRGYQSGLIR